MSEEKRSGDERFVRLRSDPRFWEMPEKENKVKIDKRFRSMFHSDSFKVQHTVDKRGRPVKHTTAEDLRRFYNLSDSEDEDDEDEKPLPPEEDEEEEEEEQGESGSGSEEESGLDSDEDSDSGPDLARGKGNMESSSEDEDEVESILRREEEEIEHAWGELCRDAPRSDAVSTRLAVCNMDWDRMKARDLLALFNSFTPKGGAVLDVKIYPSEFGKERLKGEETQGPLELKALPDDSEDDNEEEKVYREKMRDHQFQRLKYFFAVVACDSADTAAQIYEECDGYEYESSCSVLDLRFIPDDVTFDEEPKDAATDVNLAAYTPKLFTSSANATSKVQLTWDETDHERVTALNRKFNKDELLEMDFKAYLASSSEGEEEEEEAEQEVVEKKKKSEQISKYRELLMGIHKKEKQLQEDQDMEITWVPGLKETTEQLVKKKLEEKEELTPWEEFLQKKKERRKQKKTRRTQQDADHELSDDQLPADVDLGDPFFSEELGGTDVKKQKKKKKHLEEDEEEEDEEELQKQKAAMSLLMEDDDKHKHFNYDKIVERQNLSKKKRKRLLKKGEEPQEADQFQVDVKDSRFQAMFTSHLFNLDPSHPSYKKTSATQSLQAEKQRRREAERRRGEERLGAPQGPAPAPGREADGKKPMDPGLSLLVKSIKSQTERFQARKKQKTKD